MGRPQEIDKTTLNDMQERALIEKWHDGGDPDHAKPRVY